MKTALRITLKAKDGKEAWPPTPSNQTSIALMKPEEGIGIHARVIRARPTTPNQSTSTSQEDSTTPTTRSYTSDFVFEPRATQFDVYKSVGIPVVSEVIRGQKIATMIAYGAEKTGKSYTMFGVPALKDETRGLLVRVIDSIYTRSLAMMLSDEKDPVRLAVTCVEITHGDEVIDLLQQYTPPENSSEIMKRTLSETLPYDWATILGKNNTTVACECGTAADAVNVLAAALSTTSVHSSSPFLQRKADRVVLLEVVKKNSFILAVDCSPLYCKSMHTLKDIVVLLSQSRGTTLSTAPFQKSKLAQLLRQDILPTSSHMTKLLLHCRASAVDLDNLDTHSVMHVATCWKLVRSISTSNAVSEESPNAATKVTNAKSTLKTTSPTPPPTQGLKFTASLVKPHRPHGSPLHAAAVPEKESEVVTKMTGYDEEAKVFLQEEPPTRPLQPAALQMLAPQEGSSTVAPKTPTTVPATEVVQGQKLVFDLSSSSSSDEIPTRPLPPGGRDERGVPNTPSEELSSNPSDAELMTDLSMKQRVLSTKYKRLKQNCKRYNKMYGYAKEQWESSLQRLEDANQKNQDIVQKNILLMTRLEETKKQLKHLKEEAGRDEKERIIQQANEQLRNQVRPTPMFHKVFQEYEKLLGDLRTPNASETDALRSNLRAMMQVVEQTGEENTHLAELSTKLNKRLNEAHRRLEEYELNEQEYITREEQYMEQITTLQRQVALLSTYNRK